MTLSCEIVAVGTELLLGQSLDTNSARIGERLALSGIDSHFQTRVGDNADRIVSVLRNALGRSEAVIVCGGLGPTHDDVTREAIARVMGVELEPDERVAERIRELFRTRGRTMPGNNLRQTLVPVGATVIEQRLGTAPGLICPVGDRVVYALPGVPDEMLEMLERVVLPDLRRRRGEDAVIVSRELRTWGESESGLAERLAPVIERLDRNPGVTLALLASGVEGIRIRLTTKAHDRSLALARIEEEDAGLRDLLGELVFGTDSESMEGVVLGLLHKRGLTLAVEEEVGVTGGLVARRLAAEVAGVRDRPSRGASRFPGGEGQVFRGGITRSASAPGGQAPEADVVLRVGEAASPAPPGQGARRVRVWIQIGGLTSEEELLLPPDPEQLRRIACISALNRLRILLGTPPAPGRQRS